MKDSVVCAQANLLRADTEAAIEAVVVDEGQDKPEGLLGLRRAFQIAGADTGLSTLWVVEGDSTPKLVQGSQTHLFRGGLPRSRTLRKAPLEMLEQSREEHGERRPRTRGAFVLSGEGR